jgi:hypothetical protein
MPRGATITTGRDGSRRASRKGITTKGNEYTPLM